LMTIGSREHICVSRSHVHLCQANINL
jgi:hypothetical protein